MYTLSDSSKEQRDKTLGKAVTIVGGLKSSDVPLENTNVAIQHFTCHYSLKIYQKIAKMKK